MDKLEQAIIDVANQGIPDNELEQAADRVRGKLFVQTRTGPERLRSCADFQAIIPAYLQKTLSAGRALLLQDHTRECVACRHALSEARSGAGPTLIRPSTPPSRVISKAWAIAAMAAVTAGLGVWGVSKLVGPQGNGETSVQTVSGILYAVSDKGATPIFSGKTIPEGQRVRTARDSKAVVKMADGSLVEMNERSELWVSRTDHGAAIRLDRGNIIVQAAKQRTGTLDVLTADCTVSVKGTIFAVDRGTRGSRVSVVEGSVKVAQGSKSEMLKPGDQVSTDASLTQSTAADAVSWSRDSSRYLALLGELSIIKKGLDAMPSPALRHDAKMLDYVPDDTILYASIPNVGSALTEAQRLFHERLQESAVLKTWWDEQKDGPKLEEMINKLRTFSDYLGDEIVFTVSGDWEGNYTAPLLMAEIKKPNLDVFLNNELRQLSLQGAKNVPELVQLQAKTADSGNSYYRRGKHRNTVTTDGPMTIGINGNMMVVGWNQDQLNGVAQRIAQPSGNRDGGLFANVKQAYGRGAAYLLCVNMEHIARTSVHKGGQDSPKLPTGLEAMRYLIVERKDIAGATENQATLTFEGRRSGMAAWMAEPSAMGSLEFVSPNATFVASVATRSPSWMLGDIFRAMSDQNPKFEEKLEEINRQSGLRLSPSLGDPLGGDITFAIDGPLLPLPSWKIVAEVYSPDKMQWTIDQLVNAFNTSAKCDGCALRSTSEQVGDKTFHIISSDQFSYEIHYVFVDGYLLMGPSRSLLTRAIQNRETGLVLSRSDAFRSQLPRDGRLNFSAIVYHNIGAVLGPLAKQLSPSNAQQQSIQALIANSTPGLVYAYAEADRITVASTGTFFGLDLNSVALPNLIGQAMGQKVKAATRIQ